MPPVSAKLKLILLAATLCGSAALAQQPEYQIISLGLAVEANSGGQGISDSGEFATGFTDGSAFVWQSGGSSTVLPDEATRPFSTPWSVNDSGVAVGIGATTFFGSGALPLVWQNGVVDILPLPPGESLGRAYALNNNNLAVGSVDGGSVEQAVTFQIGGVGVVLNQTLAGGILRTAYGVNDSGRIVGQALDPLNAAVTKGFYLDSGDAMATDIGALSGLGHNSAIAFDVSSNGLITGSSSLNSGANARAFVWSEADGMTEVPLPASTSTAGGRGVNSSGWVVGTAGGTFAVPFLYEGNATYRLQDLLTVGGAGWELASGTSNGAFSIADNGTIVGRGLLNGALTAFAMLLIQPDSDNDGVNDNLDNCLEVANPNQTDTNEDGFGNLCDADTNNDCIINFLDVAQFSQNFMGSDPDFDFNSDGNVNFLDFQLLATRFFGQPGPSALTSCNE